MVITLSGDLCGKATIVFHPLSGPFTLSLMLPFESFQGPPDPLYSPGLNCGMSISYITMNVHTLSSLVPWSQDTAYVKYSPPPAEPLAVPERWLCLLNTLKMWKIWEPEILAPQQCTGNLIRAERGWGLRMTLGHVRSNHSPGAVLQCL